VIGATNQAGVNSPIVDIGTCRVLESDPFQSI
jgi:hypothetical protein